MKGVNKLSEKEQPKSNLIVNKEGESSTTNGGQHTRDHSKTTTKLK